MNFNNKLNNPYFERRQTGSRAFLDITNLNLDYDVKIGGYTYLANTSFKTVLNRIITTLNASAGVTDGDKGDVTVSGSGGT